MKLHAVAAPAALVVLAGCGPSAEEVGAAMLIAAPLIVAVTALVLAGFARLERRFDSTLRVAWRPTLMTLGGAAVFAVGGVVSPAGDRDRFELAVTCFGLVGAIYLGLTLIAWRIWRSVDRAAAYTWVQVPLALILLAPATVTALGGPLAEMTFGGYMYLGLAGFYGWPATLALLLGFLSEIVVRGRRRRRVGS